MDAIRATKINGRERTFYLPNTKHTDQDILQYVEPIDGKTRVFRCVNCQVRIGNECDITRKPLLSRKKYIATFHRTFNLISKDNYVCCFRCGHVLFDYTDIDDMMLSIPLYNHMGECTMIKTPYRITVFVYADPTYFVRVNRIMNKKFKSKLVFLRDMFSSLLPGKDIEVRYIIVLQAADYEVSRKLQKENHEEAFEMLKQTYKNEGLECYSFIFDTEFDTHEYLQTTQDFVLLLKIYERSFVCWTDYNSQDVEEYMIRMWLISGGNMLFGDWYKPAHSEDKNPDDDDYMEYKALLFESAYEEGAVDKPDALPAQSNYQPGFIQLIRDGHWLGYWFDPKNNDNVVYLSDKMLEKCRQCIDGKFLYPRWLFLHDYPPSVFLDKRRGHRSHLKDGLPYPLRAKDFYVPEYDRQPQNETVDEVEEVPSSKSWLSRFFSWWC